MDRVSGVRKRFQGDALTTNGNNFIEGVNKNCGKPNQNIQTFFAKLKEMNFSIQNLNLAFLVPDT